MFNVFFTKYNNTISPNRKFNKKTVLPTLVYLHLYQACTKRNEAENPNSLFKIL